MSTATASYSFNVTTEGNNHTFIYSKAKLGFKTALPMIWPAFILSGFLAYKSASSFSDGLFYLGLYTVLVTVGVMVLINLLRGKGSFVVGEQGIKIGGTTYSYKDIHSIYVKSPSGAVSGKLASTSSGFVVVGGDRVQHMGHATAGAVATATSTVASAATQLSAASGAAIKNSIKEKSYKICILFGEKEKAIANGLNEKTARVMLEKIDGLI